MNSLDISEIKIYPLKERRKNLIAYCTATFNSALVVTGIRIKEGEQGIYVAFPSRRIGEKKITIVYPATPEARKEIANRILATYVINHCLDDAA